MFRKFDDWKAAADAAFLARWAINHDDAGSSPEDLRRWHYEHLSEGETVQELAEKLGRESDLSDPDPMTARDLARRHRIPGDPGAFTALQVEAALCVWESMLDRLSDPAQSDLEKARQANGSASLRLEAVEIGLAAERVWGALDEDTQQGLVPYDWEFIPAFVGLCGWGPDGAAIIPSDADAIAAMMKKAGDVE